jgi:hypothetical protein
MEPSAVRGRPTGMTPSPRLLVLLTLGVLVLAACSSGDRAAGDTGPAATPSAASPTPTSPTPAASGPTLTLTGPVTDGVEAGCTIMTSGDTLYELQGDEVRSLQGRTVTVRGHVLEGMMTFCQQGTPFQVVEVSGD